MNRDYRQYPLTIDECQKTIDAYFKPTEIITEKVKFDARLHKIEYMSLGELQDYISDQMEMAYIAGANRIDTNDIPSYGVKDTGEIIVLARGYVKDKGYRR